MKNGVDKADLEKGIKLPCILIENKVDLLKEDNEKDSKELEEFSKKIDLMDVLEHQLKLEKI